MTDTGLRTLTGLRSLVELNLRCLNISIRGLRRIAALPQLRRITIDGEKFPLWALRCLRCRRPRLEIRGIPSSSFRVRIRRLRYWFQDCVEWLRDYVRTDLREQRYRYAKTDDGDDEIPF